MQEKMVLLLGTAVRGSASRIAVVALGAYTVHLKLRSAQKCHKFNQLNCDKPLQLVKHRHNLRSLII